MSYLLKPANGTYLSPDEVIESLRAGFDTVDTDRDAGADYVGDVIAGLIRVGLSGEPVQSLLAVQENASRICIADATEDFLDIIFIPNQPIRVSIYN